MPLFKVQGVDVDGKIFTRANALLWNESDEAFSFVLHQALPRLFGRNVCENLSVILSDGDPQLISSIDTAIEQGIYPNATRKRCFWHAVHQEFTKQFVNAECDSATNTIIRAWLNSLAYKAETSSDFNRSHEALTDWIETNVDTSFLTKTRKETLQTTRLERMRTFIRKCVALQMYWAKFTRMGLTDLGHITTAISEAGFAVLKSGKLAVHAQMGIDMTAGVMFTQERLSRQRGALRSDRNVNTTGLPNARHETQAQTLSTKLTPYAVDLLSVELFLSQNYHKVRISPVRWLTPFRRSEAQDECASDREDDDLEPDSPIPRNSYCREVTLANEKLTCSWILSFDVASLPPRNLRQQRARGFP